MSIFTELDNLQLPLRFFLNCIHIFNQFGMQQFKFVRQEIHNL
jgi:hypothetical protein